jgi:hypothetical protein
LFQLTRRAIIIIEAYRCYELQQMKASASQQYAPSLHISAMILFLSGSLSEAFYAFVFLCIRDPSISSPRCGVE